jgi:hypothetical protein
MINFARIYDRTGNNQLYNRRTKKNAHKHTSVHNLVKISVNETQNLNGNMKRYDP